jgi:hypothetical protein
MTTSLKALEGAAMADALDATRAGRLPRVSDTMIDPSIDDDEPNPMFALLVEGEQDLVGLLAYGLYKQNKRDWLIAHRARTGRDPTQAELDSFILGERIPRRTATYRRLAQDWLDNRAETSGPRRGLMDGLMAAPANDMRGAGNQAHAAMATAARQPITWRYIGFLLGMLVVMAILFRLAAGWLFGTGR